MLQKIERNSNLMSLSRMGSRYPSRLSFSRSMLRRLFFDNWKISKPKLDLDKNGYGTAVYEIKIQKEIYSLVCFSQHIENDDRSDRVIASKWDTAYVLHSGPITIKELDRLKINIPLQESGRNSPKELILSRANKSVRLFEYVLNCLARGDQPDIKEINKVGYLLRTTAVYGSGKFGLSDFVNTKNCTVFNQPYRAEMLAVYIVREFSVELVEHVAMQKNPNKAVKLKREIKQHLGIGNSTGLGMAPFIIKHPKLINKWMSQYQKLINNIINKKVNLNFYQKYIQLLSKADRYLMEVTTNDSFQIKKNETTTKDLNKYINYVRSISTKDLEQITWFDLIVFSLDNCNYDTQEIAQVQLIELYPEESELLAEDMADEEEMEINGEQKLRNLFNIIEKNYGWALKIDFSNKKIITYSGIFLQPSWSLDLVNALMKKEVN